MTMPSTSPMAQPVRQCSVAWAAMAQLTRAGAVVLVCVVVRVCSV